MVRRSRLKPREISAEWPNRELDDPTFEAIRLYVVALRQAVGDRSVNSVAREIDGLDQSTLQAVLAGDAWPDAITVARTERGLGARLWHGPVSLPEDGPGQGGKSNSHAPTVEQAQGVGE